MYRVYFQMEDFIFGFKKIVGFQKTLLKKHNARGLWISIHRRCFCIYRMYTILFFLMWGIVPFVVSFCVNNFHGLIFSAPSYWWRNFQLPVQVRRFFLKNLVPNLDTRFKIRWPDIQNDGSYTCFRGNKARFRSMGDKFLHTRLPNNFLSSFGAVSQLI